MNKVFLEQVYRTFCKAEGNQHIASEFAVVKLSNLICRFKVKSVLEVGLGIGTIPCCLLKDFEDIEYTGTEENPFCLEVLKNNIYDRNLQVSIFSELSKVPDRKFDLIIIDGSDSNLAQIKEYISRRCIVAIEGDRKLQEETLLKLFPNQRNVHSISVRKNGNYSPFPSDHWRGGLKIIFVNPNLYQKYWWVREKIVTKVKYLLRYQFQ